MIPAWLVEFNEEADSGGVSGSLTGFYTAFRRVMFPLTSLLQSVRKTNPKWGGQGVFFDVVLTRYAPKGMVFVLPPPSFSGVRKDFVTNLPVIDNPNRGIITGICTL